jgi:hypothetical protein
MACDVLYGVICTCQCDMKSCLVIQCHAGLCPDLDGTAMGYDGFDVIRADPAMVGKDYTETLIHEFTHRFNPRWNEETVTLFAKQLTDLIYFPQIRRQGGLDV